jgi:phage tail tape-measure protein
MALTRKFLASKGIEEAVIEEIITAHTETVNALKEQRDGYKEDADKLSTVQGSLDILKRNYDAKVQELDEYKKGVEAKELARSKSKAYKQVLKELKASHIDSILKASQSELDKIELDEDGKIKDVDKLKESIKKEWADFLVTEGQQGANTATPPANEGSKMSKEDIMKIKDPAARQKAMFENSELFGIK